MSTRESGWVDEKNLLDGIDKASTFLEGLSTSTPPLGRLIGSYRRKNWGENKGPTGGPTGGENNGNIGGKHPPCGPWGAHGARFSFFGGEGRKSPK